MNSAEMTEIIAEGGHYKLATLSYDGEPEGLLDHVLQEMNLKVHREIVRSTTDSVYDHYGSALFKPEMCFDGEDGFEDEMGEVIYGMYGINCINNNEPAKEEDCIDVFEFLSERAKEEGVELSCFYDFHEREYHLCATRLFIIQNGTDVTAFYCYCARLYG